MSKGDDTRAAVMQQALSLASEVGLFGVTIGKLAERVGMSKSGLFAHFSSKENLQVQLLDEASALFIEHVISPALRQRRGEPRVRALFERWLAWGRSELMPGGCIFVTAVVELDDRPGPARDRLLASQRDLLDALSTAARIAKQEGHFRADLDEQLFAHELYGIVYGHHFLFRMFRSDDVELRTRASFERLLRDAHPRRAAH